MILLHIMGFLGADPETRYTPSGQKVTTLRVATKTRKGGQEETVWWRLTVWGDQFDKMLVHFKKGSAIYAVGEMSKLEIYQDKSGQPQISYEATVRSLHFPPYSKSEGEGGAPRQQQQSYGQESNYAAQRTEGRADHFEQQDEDQIPF